MGYYSKFFDVLCYGAFVEATSAAIELPDDTIEDVGAFVTWVHAGHITSSRLEELWVFGKQLQSAKFSKDCMRLMFDRYGDCAYQISRHINNLIKVANRWPEAKIARYVYENTLYGSHLRLSIKDLIQANGQLCKECIKQCQRGEDDSLGCFQEEWETLIKERGDLVLNVVRDGSFSDNLSIVDCQFFTYQHDEYLLEISGRLIEDFVAGKKITVMR